MPGVNTNVNAQVTINALTQNERDMARAMQRLSTGKRINSAEDDAAGLAVASRMTAQIKGLNQAVQNARQAVSMTEVAESAVVEVSKMLMRMRELAVASQNGSNTASDRNAMSTEFTQLQTEIERISNNTQFNGQNILDGLAGKSSGANIATTVVGTNSDIATTAVHAVSGAADHSNNKWTIAGHGFANNDVVTYHKGGGTQPTGMTDGGTYHIVGVSGNDFQVAATSGGSAIALSSTNGHADQWFTKNTVTYASHGFSTGDAIEYYHGGSTAMAGLTSGATYYAIKVDDNTLQLASSATNATAGTAIGLTGTGAAKGLGNNAQWLGKNSIEITAHSYATGDEVVYDNGSGTSLGGLTSGTTYYAVKQDANNIKLATSYANAVAGTPVVVRLTGTGNAAQTLYNDIVTFQVGANASQSITVAFGEFNTGHTRGAFSGAINASTIKVSTAASAGAALSIIDTAIAGVSAQRANYGAALNRLNMSIANLSNAKINAEASRARVLDTDYAAETAELSRTQIIAQAGIAMLAQANMQPQGVLSLLQG